MKYSLNHFRSIRNYAEGLFAARFGRMPAPGSFTRSVVMLGGGSAAAQGMVVLATPALTRLFSPSDFGTLGAFISIVWIWCQTIAWQYDQAIPLAPQRGTAKNLLALSLLVAALMLGVIAVTSGPFADRLFGSLESTGLLPFLWLMPFSVMGAGVFQILNCWAVREKAYRSMASARVGQAVAIIAAQLIGGGLWGGPFGLVLGDTIGRCLGMAFLAVMLKRAHRDDSSNISLAGISHAARRYRRFPVFAMGSQLVSNAATMVPPLLIAALFSTQEAGWFALAIRVVGAPSLLVGQAVGTVYWAEAAEKIHTKPSEIKVLFIRVITRISALFIIPMAVLVITGPWLFSMVFGPTWRPAGEYLQYLAAPFLLRIAVGPISRTLDILERQDWQILWEASRATLIIGGIWSAHYAGWSAADAVKLYAAAMAVSYSAVIVISIIAMNRRISAHETKSHERTQPRPTSA